MSPRTRLARAVHRLRDAGPSGRRFVARAWLAVLPVELSLATLGLARTLRWIDALPARRSALAEAVPVADGERLVRAAYRCHALPGRCLGRSVVQYLLHRRDGVGARVVFGVRRRAGLDAHAWVEPAAGPSVETGFARLERVEPSP